MIKKAWISFRIPEETRRKLRIELAWDGISLQELGIKLFSRWLKDRKGAKRK